VKNEDIGVNAQSWQGEGRNSPLRLTKTPEYLTVGRKRDLAGGKIRRVYTFSAV